MSNQFSNRSSEEQIRQRIRQQLQQRLPSLAQQLHPGDGSDRNNSLTGAGLQSFGGGQGVTQNQDNINIISRSNGGNGGGGNGGGDYFNSDSFRATGSIQENRQQQSAGAAVVDLQYHGQPFINNEYEQEEEEDKEQFGESEGESNRVMTDRTEGEEQQLSPVNMAEFQYQHQLIEELIQENRQLREQVDQSEGKLRKVEAQLNKTKQWVRELGTIKEDIITLKQTAEEVEQLDKLTTENEILKSQIQDLETRVNTLSRAGEDARMDEKFRFEKAYKHVNDENRLLTEKYRASQQMMTKAEEEIIRCNAMLHAKELEIGNLHTNWKKLHEEFTNSIKEQKLLQLQNEELRKATREYYGSTKTLGMQPRITAKEFSIEEQQNAFSSQKEFASIRNKSMSGDDGQEKILNHLAEQVEKDFSERAEKGTVGIRYIHDKNETQSNANIRSDQTSQQKEHDNSYPYHFGNKHNQQTYQNNINVKNYQPIQITIASPSDQTMVLAERCKKLEEYCRELIITNKILDLENRTAVAQILHLTDPKNQLQNLTAALSFIAKSGKIYSDKKSTQFGAASLKKSFSYQQYMKSNHQSVGKENKGTGQNQNNAIGFKQQMSLRNLQALRQTGAPPLNHVFQNNNSCFIVQKFNGMQLSESNKGLEAPGRNHMRGQLINYQSSNSMGGAAMSRPSNKDYQNQPLSTLEGNPSVGQNNTFSNQQYFSHSSNDNHSVKQQMNPTFTNIDAQNMPTFEDRHYASNNLGSPILSDECSLTLIDITLNEIQKEIHEKSGKQLHISKITDGFYKIGNDRIVKLVYDEQSQRILIRIPTEDAKSVVNSRVQEPSFVDFIEFLIEERYIRVDQHHVSE